MTTLDQAIENFIVYCRVRRQLSPRTTKSYYGYPLRSILLPWCHEHGVDQVQYLTPDVVDAFTLALENRPNRITGEPLRAATRLAYLKALRHFLAWAREHGGVTDPGRVGLPRLRHIQKDVLSEPEMRQLEDAARSERDKLMIRLMVETAARRDEVATLRLEDVIERERGYSFVRVRGKTGERMPPISASLYRRLKAYAAGKSGRPRSRSPMLFLADRRRAGAVDFEPLTGAGIYHAIRDAADRADLDRSRIHPHLLRASAITRMCSRGMHPALVSQITGVSVAVIAAHYAYPSHAQAWEAAMRTWDDR